MRRSMPSIRESVTLRVTTRCDPADVRRDGSHPSTSIEEASLISESLLAQLTGDDFICNGSGVSLSVITHISRLTVC